MPGIWIRSQDKRILRFCNNISINYSAPVEIIADLEYYTPDTENFISLGEYATKERAMQVLDEIQARIEEYKKDEIYIEHGWDDADKLKTVYQMPAE